VLKSLSFQHKVQESKQILEKWADILVVTQRNLLDTVCSFAIARKRDCWFDEDSNETKISVTAQSLVWIVKLLRNRWDKERTLLAKAALRLGKPMITIGESVASDDIPELLRCYGIPVSGIENSPIKPKKSRKLPPRDMIANLDEVIAWLDQIAPNLHS